MKNFLKNPAHLISRDIRQNGNEESRAWGAGLKAAWRGTIGLSQRRCARQSPPCPRRTALRKGICVCPRGAVQALSLVCAITAEPFVYAPFSAFQQVREKKQVRRTTERCRTPGLGARAPQGGEAVKNTGEGRRTETPCSTTPTAAPPSLPPCQGSPTPLPSLHSTQTPPPHARMRGLGVLSCGRLGRHRRAQGRVYRAEQFREFGSGSSVL